MSHTAAGPTSQTQLPIESPIARTATGPMAPASRSRPARQRATARDAAADAGARTAPSRRATGASARPLQAVPRLLLTRKEAAASLGMSLDTFERRVQPVIKLVPCGQLVLVPLRELERWCDDHAHYLASAL